MLGVLLGIACSDRAAERSGPPATTSKKTVSARTAKAKKADAAPPPTVPLSVTMLIRDDMTLLSTSDGASVEIRLCANGRGDIQAIAVELCRLRGNPVWAEQTHIALAATADVSYSSILKIMDTIRGAGFSKLRFGDPQSLPPVVPLTSFNVARPKCSGAPPTCEAKDGSPKAEEQVSPPRRANSEAVLRVSISRTTIRLNGTPVIRIDKLGPRPTIPSLMEALKPYRGGDSVAELRADSSVPAKVVLKVVRTLNLGKTPNIVFENLDEG